MRNERAGPAGKHSISADSAAARHPSCDSLPEPLRRFALLTAATDIPVLLYGETGCGKSDLARRIHELGPRSTRPFVHVNCASIPAALFEREMFGHVRGAFTDAKESRPGFFEEANGGTLLLDELGELPMDLQPKLLAVLDEGIIRRLGSTRAIRVHVRIIAATNRDLFAMIRRNEFRADLFYRCAVLEYRIPPLRQRRDELPGLAQQLLDRVGTGAPPCLADETLHIFQRYAWPGNIRELDNALMHATARAGGGTIRPKHLPQRLRQNVQAAAGVDGEPLESGRPGRYTAPRDPGEEVALIREALREEGFNRTRAARRLGMARATLWTKLHRYGII